jgi:predicted nucleotidyltransferase
MELVTIFAPALEALLPQTYRLLYTARLVLHPAVERVILTGSRGIGGRPRPDSDVDLSLVVARGALPADQLEREQMLCAVIEATLLMWQGMVECDLAAVYDQRACGLNCLAGQRDAPSACDYGERCRFGIYKMQKGFSGEVQWAVIELERMYPVLEIWRRP